MQNQHVHEKEKTNRDTNCERRALQSVTQLDILESKPDTTSPDTPAIPCVSILSCPETVLRTPLPQVSTRRDAGADCSGVGGNGGEGGGGEGFSLPLRAPGGA